MVAIKMADLDTCKNAIPWASLFSMIIAISGCVFFTLSFADGMEGFLYQLNTITKMTDSTLSSSVRSIMFKLAAIFCFSVIIFLVINVFATSALSMPSESPTNSRRNEPRFFLYRILSSSKTIAFTIGFAHTVLVFWLIILCISSMAFIVYVIFYISMQQFCAFVDNQCFDFRILIPVVKKLTNDKVDLIFCKEKKDAICNTSHVSNFFIAFISCILALLGIVYFLMCLAANFTRLSARNQSTQRKKGQHYAMNMGTVDSDSIIMHSMGK